MRKRDFSAPLVSSNGFSDCNCPLTALFHRGGFKAHALSLAEEAALVLIDVELRSLPCLKVAFWQVEAAQGGNILGFSQPMQEARACQDEVAVAPLATARDPASHLALPAYGSRSEEKFVVSKVKRSILIGIMPELCVQVASDGGMEVRELFSEKQRVFPAKGGESAKDW